MNEQNTDIISALAGVLELCFVVFYNFVAYFGG